ncbi:MAG TPA: FtsX-like permease family protein [Acidimicrobiia bacterium]|nr:FtsX-like permease family protein [Acidimicrobiia bacterium]
MGRGSVAAVAVPAGMADSPKPVLTELAGVEKSHRMGRADAPALRGVDLSILAGEMVAVVGPSVTTNVLERTREIGVLRSIGARARDVRRIFTTEGMVLALSGWVVGIPLGYGLARLLVRLVWEVVEVRLPAVFPPGNILVALAGSSVLGPLVLFLPVRRAAALRPGDALRHP